MRIACIGSRNIGADEKDICFKLGSFIAKCRGEIHTGNAEGADQAFASGGNEVDPGLVNLHLPWPGFNEEAIVEGNVIHLPPYPWCCVDLAMKAHPRWQYLKQGAKKLHIRNASIILPRGHTTHLVLALPSQKPGGGGTGQGMRIALNTGIDVVNLNGATQVELAQLCERIRALGEKYE
jgi:hypothetical protein